MSNEEPKYSCPECHSDQHVLFYEVRLHMHVQDVREWDENGEPARTRLLDEGEGEAPEEYGLDLRPNDLDDNVERFHCTDCGIVFDEPVRIDSSKEDRGHSS